MKPLSLDKLISNPVDGLSVLAPLLIEDRQIKETENLENLYKNLIKHISSQNDQELKFLVAKTQKDIGFILKYKSYGIKASIPIGFSLFFLEPNGILILKKRRFIFFPRILVTVLRLFVLILNGRKNIRVKSILI